MNNTIITTLALERPLIVFDIESTGTDVAVDRIISLAALKLIPNDLLATDDTISAEWLFNPGCPIPAEATKVHGITDDQVKDCLQFAERADFIRQFFAGADLCGFNLLKFDVPILWEEFARAGVEWDLKNRHIVDASEIFRRKEPRTLTAALQKFCGREHSGAHNALADVKATWDVLHGQRAFYPDIGTMSVAALAEFSSQDEWDGRPAQKLDLAGYIIRDADGVARYTLKKVRGVAVDSDPGFGEWMLRNTFPSNTKQVLRALLYP